MIRYLLYQAIKLGNQIRKVHPVQLLLDLCCTESLCLPPYAVSQKPTGLPQVSQQFCWDQGNCTCYWFLPNHKQKPPKWLLHKAAQLTQAKLGMTRCVPPHWPNPQPLGVCASSHSPATSKPSITRYWHHGNLSLSSSNFISKAETCQTCQICGKAASVWFIHKLIIHLPQSTRLLCTPPSVCTIALFLPNRCHQAQILPKASDRKRDQGSSIIKSKWTNILATEKCNPEWTRPKCLGKSFRWNINKHSPHRTKIWGPLENIRGHTEAATTATSLKGEGTNQEKPWGWQQILSSKPEKWAWGEGWALNTSKSDHHKHMQLHELPENAWWGGFLCKVTRTGCQKDYQEMCLQELCIATGKEATLTLQIWKCKQLHLWLKQSNHPKNLSAAIRVCFLPFLTRVFHRETNVY